MSFKNIIGKEVSDKKNDWESYEITRIIVDENGLFCAQVDYHSQEPEKMTQSTGLPYKTLEEIKNAYRKNEMIQEILP